MKVRVDVKFDRKVQVVVDRSSNPSIWDRTAKTDTVNEGLFFSMTDAYANIRQIITQGFNYNRATPVTVLIQFFANNGDGTIRKEDEKTIDLKTLQDYPTIQEIGTFNAHKNWYRTQASANPDLVTRLNWAEAKMKGEAVKAVELAELVEEVRAFRKEG